MPTRKPTIRVYPAPELKEQIEQRAEERGISVSSWMKEAARQQLQQEEIENAGD